MKNAEEIDLRSEAVTDYLEHIPHWTLRSGIYVISTIVLILLILSTVIQYPSIVISECRITSKAVLKPIVAKVDGRLERLFVSESQIVVKGEVLGWIECTAKHQEVLNLEAELNRINNLFTRNDYDEIGKIKLAQFKSLGEIQAAYQVYQQSYIQIFSLYYDKFYDKKKRLLSKDLAELEKKGNSLTEQVELNKRDVVLAVNEFTRNEKLYKEKVISAADLDREESKTLAKKLSLKSEELNRIDNNTQILSKKKELLDLEKSLLEETENFGQSLKVLLSSIASWKSKYLLLAPIAGAVFFSSTLQDNQYLKQNSELFFIGDVGKSFFGEVKIPQNNFGKVKAGQRVLLKFRGYPYEEYGICEGKIENISQFPNAADDAFYSIVNLPIPLVTSKGKVLILKNGMLATAEIITEDLTLHERIFYSFKRILGSR